ncbi:MAG: serine acetyltransferase [Bacteriovoracaceae bacterium]|nr:serine acetyltransferase [Bacteriovoracaceae bacterium]
MQSDRLAIWQRLSQRHQTFAATYPGPGRLYQDAVGRWGMRILGLLFPHYATGKEVSPANYAEQGELLAAELAQFLQVFITLDEANTMADEFCDYLSTLQELLYQDAQAMEQGDPAANNVDEVIWCYPGFLALGLYRTAHFFYQHEQKIFARLLSEYGHQKTGIDIHPGAQIGRHCCLDHGTGIVIGETAVIGDHVKIYQGVTIGALSVQKSDAHQKRHPTIENDVIIYAHATILGGDTTIGHNAIIGGNVWLTHSVAPHARVQCS